MKAFDLEAAKRGAAVCTRCGCKARIVCFNVDSPLFSIVAMVRYSASGKETPQSYRDDGGWLPANRKCSQDLMMCDDDYLEKLERGEYDHIADALKMVGPAIKQNLNTDREYWRRVYAGHIAGGLASHNGLNIIGSEIIVAKASCSMADALIEELEKTETK